MDTFTLASVVAAGSAALVWLRRIAKRHLRLSMDLRFRIRTGDESG